MNRLRVFPDSRYVGTRDDMVVYDCDDEEEFQRISQRVGDEDLVARTLLSSFAPDTIDEARNRGFASWRSRSRR